MHSIQNKKGKGGIIALKIDMEKAHDRVKWHFLFEIIKCLDFSALGFIWEVNVSLQSRNQFFWMELPTIFSPLNGGSIKETPSHLFFVDYVLKVYLDYYCKLGNKITLKEWLVRICYGVPLISYMMFKLDSELFMPNMASFSPLHWLFWTAFKRGFFNFQ